MKDRVAQSDILPGVTAAAAFLALAYPLGLPLWISLPLSIGIYVGLRFLFSKDRKREDQEVAETIEQIRFISRSLGDDTASTDIKKRVLELCDVSDQLLSALRNRPEDTARDIGLLQLYLQLVREPISQFISLPHKERHDLVDGPSQQLGKTLDNTTAKFRQLLDEVLADNYAEFKSTLEALNETLSISDDPATGETINQPVEQSKTVQINGGEGEEPK